MGRMPLWARLVDALRACDWCRRQGRTVGGCCSAKCYEQLQDARAAAGGW